MFDVIGEIIVIFNGMLSRLRVQEVRSSLLQIHKECTIRLLKSSPFGSEWSLLKFCRDIELGALFLTQMSCKDKHWLKGQNGNNGTTRVKTAADASRTDENAGRTRIPRWSVNEIKSMNSKRTLWELNHHLWHISFPEEVLSKHNFFRSHFTQIHSAFPERRPLIWDKRSNKNLILSRVSHETWKNQQIFVVVVFVVFIVDHLRCCQHWQHWWS